MQKYQYLTLIGAILGILLAFAYIALISFDRTQELEVFEGTSRATENQYSAAAIILYIIAILAHLS
jgi:hypothetical protein